MAVDHMAAAAQQTWWLLATWQSNTVKKRETRTKLFLPRLVSLYLVFGLWAPSCIWLCRNVVSCLARQKCYQAAVLQVPGSSHLKQRLGWNRPETASKFTQNGRGRNWLRGVSLEQTEKMWKTKDKITTKETKNAPKGRYLGCHKKTWQPQCVT